MRGEFYCVGISGPEGFEDDLRLAALSDGPSTKGSAPYVIVGVRSGSEPVASMALRYFDYYGSLLAAIAHFGVSGELQLGLALR
jgi:hypothetical protein